MNRAQGYALIAVLLPLVLMAAWLGRLVYTEHHSVQVTLAVEAYDPRDLFSGHFLQYAVKYGKNVCADAEEDAETCVCLTSETPASLAQAGWTGACAQRPSDCGVFLRGHCTNARFDADIDRYYFSEDYVAELKAVPSDATISVRINKEGQGLVAGFFVKGVPLEDYLRTGASGGP